MNWKQTQPSDQHFFWNERTDKPSQPNKTYLQNTWLHVSETEEFSKLKLQNILQKKNISDWLIWTKLIKLLWRCFIEMRCYQIGHLSSRPILSSCVLGSSIFGEKFLSFVCKLFVWRERKLLSYGEEEDTRESEGGMFVLNFGNYEFIFNLTRPNVVTLSRLKFVLLTTINSKSAWIRLAFMGLTWIKVGINGQTDWYIRMI